MHYRIVAGQPRPKKGRLGLRTIPWPARSPDLNPIENIWSLLKRNLHAQLKTADDLEVLKRKLVECWNEQSLDVIDDPISMTRRVGSAIHLKGAMTKY